MGEKTGAVVVLYLLVLLASPLAVLRCGNPRQAAVNLALWILALTLTAAGFAVALLVPIFDALVVVDSQRRVERPQRPNI